VYNTYIHPVVTIDKHVPKDASVINRTKQSYSALKHFGFYICNFFTFRRVHAGYIYLGDFLLFVTHIGKTPSLFILEGEFVKHFLLLNKYGELGRFGNFPLS
jgi:hypothetical protein